MAKGKPTDPQKIKDQKIRGHLVGMVKEAKKVSDTARAEKLAMAMRKGHENSGRGHTMVKGNKQKNRGDLEGAKKTFSVVGKDGFHKKRK